VISAEGRFPDSPLPRILGRDFAGRVVEGPSDLLGLDVWGSGGDLGISRDGVHAQYVVLPAGAVARRPANLTVEEAAACGVPYVTAWRACAEVEEGEWVVIAGAAGAVGRAATEMARSFGGRVIGLVRDEAEARRVGPVDAVARFDLGDLADVVREATDGAGCDHALNGVGAAVFPGLVDALAPDGELVVYSAAQGREATFDLLSFYRKRLRFVGVNTADTDAESAGQIMMMMCDLMEGGDIHALPVAETWPLAEAAHAYARVATAPGKVVLLPPRGA
jgi:NADPH:quinone reductase-like Zn-dependent oxidoreductase